MTILVIHIFWWCTAWSHMGFPWFSFGDGPDMRYLQLTQICRFRPANWNLLHWDPAPASLSRIQRDIKQTEFLIIDIGHIETSLGFNTQLILPVHPPKSSPIYQVIIASWSGKQLLAKAEGAPRGKRICSKRCLAGAQVSCWQCRRRARRCWGSCLTLFSS